MSENMVKIIWNSKCFNKLSTFTDRLLDNNIWYKPIHLSDTTETERGMIREYVSTSKE